MQDNLPGALCIWRHSWYTLHVPPSQCAKAVSCQQCGVCGSGELCPSLKKKLSSASVVLRCLAKSCGLCFRHIKLIACSTGLCLTVSETSQRHSQQHDAIGYLLSVSLYDCLLCSANVAAIARLFRSGLLCAELCLRSDQVPKASSSIQ
jgi:hypothetical protein